MRGRFVFDADLILLPRLRIEGAPEEICAKHGEERLRIAHMGGKASLGEIGESGTARIGRVVLVTVHLRRPVVAARVGAVAAAAELNDPTVIELDLVLHIKPELRLIELCVGVDGQRRDLGAVDRIENVDRRDVGIGAKIAKTVGL
jgi:hypothetical protein